MTTLKFSSQRRPRSRRRSILRHASRHSIFRSRDFPTSLATEVAIRLSFLILFPSFHSFITFSSPKSLSAVISNFMPQYLPIAINLVIHSTSRFHRTAFPRFAASVGMPMTASIRPQNILIAHNKADCCFIRFKLR